MEFCPAILAKTESEFREKVDRVRHLGLPLHVDVMDGIFVPQMTWADPTLVMQIADDLPVEAHLMVHDPEHAAVVWLAAGAKRVWIHAESTDRVPMILRSPPNQAERLGVVLNPETPISRVIPIIDKVTAIIVMGVTPGKSGQEFQEIALEKVYHLKELRPHLWIKIDGGVNVDNIAKIAEAGTDSVATASSLTNHPNPSAGLAEMRQRISKPGEKPEPDKPPSIPPKGGRPEIPTDEPSALDVVPAEVGTPAIESKAEQPEDKKEEPSTLPNEQTDEERQL